MSVLGEHDRPEGATEGLERLEVVRSSSTIARQAQQIFRYLHELFPRPPVPSKHADDDE